MTAQRRVFLTAMVGVVATTACSALPRGARRPEPACERGDTALVRTELFMGRNIPGGGVVSDEAWKGFLESFVTPRFPDGLTISENSGQWRNAAGTVERERTMILTILNAGDTVARRSLDEIAVEYLRRFRQEAVMRVRDPACVHFVR